MLSRLLAKSRYLVLVAVISTFLAAITLFVYGAIETVVVIVGTVAKAEVSSKGAKTLVLTFIELVDLFLLGTVLFITAIGLYELFIDEHLETPRWLEIHSIDDLKNKLIGVVVVVLGVVFLGQVVTWDGQRDLLRFGGAIALVIVALTWFLSKKVKKYATPDDGE